jgi:hypothetical protein
MKGDKSWTARLIVPASITPALGGPFDLAAGTVVRFHRSFGSRIAANGAGRRFLITDRLYEAMVGMIAPYADTIEEVYP